MPLTIPAAAEARLLEYMFGKTTAPTFNLRLYVNNFTPGTGIVTANFTECTLPGYSNVSLSANQWTMTAGSPTVASFPTVTFTFSGGTQSVYGYYLVEVASGLVVLAERFSNGPFTITMSGDQVQVNLSLTLADTGG